MTQSYSSHRNGFASLFTTVTVLSMTLVQSALSVACTWDGECFDTQFCETALSQCKDCLKCEDLMREPPSAATSCIRDVGDCGACFKGLVEDRFDEMKCVAPTEGEEGSSGGTAMWSAIGVFLVLLVIVVAAFLTHLWRTRNNKSHSIHNDTILPVISASYPQPPSAPESPPPYRPSSQLYTGEASDADDPLIKVRPSPPQYVVSDGPQKANVYNPPAYVRYGDQQEPPVEVNDVNDNLVVHDETTTESLWTPGPSNDNATSLETSASEPEPKQPGPAPAQAGELGAALAAARNTDLVQPPAKRTKTRDQNENVNVEDRPHEPSHEGGSRSAQQFNIVIQVNQKLA